MSNPSFRPREGDPHHDADIGPCQCGAWHHLELPANLQAFERAVKYAQAAFVAEMAKHGFDPESGTTTTYDHYIRRGGAGNKHPPSFEVVWAKYFSDQRRAL